MKKQQIVLCFEHSSETMCYFLFVLLDLRLLLALLSLPRSERTPVCACVCVHVSVLERKHDLGLGSNSLSVGPSRGTLSCLGLFRSVRGSGLVEV